MGGEDLDGGFDATDARELEVHEDDVGEVRRVSGEGLLTGVGFGDDFDIGFEGEGGGEAGADDEVVVYEEEAHV